jgi:hypothetical protein
MYKAYAELAAKVEGSKLASFKEYEEERQVVRKTYLDTCPDTPAKMEVYLCVCVYIVKLLAVLVQKYQYCKTYLDTCPHTPAKMEVHIYIYVFIYIYIYIYIYIHIYIE